MSRGLRGWDRVNLDRPWCCLFSYGFLQLVYSILGKGELDAIIASYLIKAKSKNRVPDILESHPRNPARMGHPVSRSPKTTMGRNGPPARSAAPALWTTQAKNNQGSATRPPNFSGASASPKFDNIVSNSLSGGGGVVVHGANGSPGDAFMGTPNIPVTTPFNAYVNINDGRFPTITDLDVSVTMTDQNLNDLHLKLLSPSLTGSNVQAAPAPSYCRCARRDHLQRARYRMH